MIKYAEIGYDNDSILICKSSFIYSTTINVFYTRLGIRGIKLNVKQLATKHADRHTI